jgi:hypothetical protein
MRKLLDVSGVQRHENNLQRAQLQAQKKISSMVKIVCGYLGNQLFFCPTQPLAAAYDPCEGRLVPGNEFEKSDAGNGILECMGHHAGPQALAQMREYAEEDSIDSDHNHHSSALVPVRQPKEDT